MESMTGYGYAAVKSMGVSALCEVRSYNHRFIDMSVSVQPQDPGITAEIESVIRRTIGRGRVYVMVKYSVDKKVEDILPLGRLKKVRATLKKYAKAIGTRDEVGMEELISVSLLLSRSEEMHPPHVAKICSAAFANALKKMKTMRRGEGARLTKAVSKLASELNDCYITLKQRVPLAVADLKAKIISAIGNNGTETETAVINSIKGQVTSSILERIDVEEEVERLGSHIVELKKLINGKEDVGRKLEFLCQELNRELNTLAQKAKDPVLCDSARSGKLIVDKIKEQSENIQ